MKETLVKRFIADSKPLISYVKDKHGFKKGVVVALDANRIGWSLVSKEDYEPYRGSVAGLPKVAIMLKELTNDESDVVAHVLNTVLEQQSLNGIQFGLMRNRTSVLHAMDAHPLVSMPAFDRETGLRLAIERALNDNQGTSNVPADIDLRVAIARMIDRAQVYFESKQ